MRLWVYPIRVPVSLQQLQDTDNTIWSITNIITPIRRIVVLIQQYRLLVYSDHVRTDILP